MSAIPSEIAWSRGRWWGMILAVTTLQVLVVFFLGERRQLIPRRAGSASYFTLVSDRHRGSAVAELLEIGDPTLFALPHSQNFSGRAWLVPGPPVRPSFSWTEPERWLTQAVAELGTSIDDIGRKNRLRYRTFDDKLPPVVSRIEAPPLPLPERSTARVDGAEARALIAMPDLPSVPHSNVLANTVVQAGVAPSGFALSAVVLNGSGSAVADGLALDAVRSVRFKPLPVRDPLAMTWAVFTFRWHTVPATNSASAGTPP